MKKLRLNFEELKAEFELMDKKAMKSISGGYDCVFNLMGYLSAKYGGSQNAGSYMGNYQGSYQYDPYGNVQGISSTDANNYISQNFYYQANPGSVEASYVLNGNDPSSTMIANIRMGGIAHAVEIQCSYNNGQYKVYDPSTGGTYNVGISDIISWGVVCGLK